MGASSYCVAMSVNVADWISGGNAIGGIIAVIASAISNIGTNMQKKSHNTERARPSAEQRSYYMRPQWWIGFALVVLGSVGDFVALGFATQALVSALGGGTTLISNVLVARFWNREDLYRTDLMGVAAVIVGAVIFALTTNASQSYTLVQLEQMLERRAFLIYAVVTGIFILLLLMTIATSKLYALRARVTEALLDPLVKKLDKVLHVQQGHIVQLQKRVHELEHRGQALHEGSYYSTFPAMQSWRLVVQPQGRVRWVDQYVYVACGGVAGSMSVLCAGCVSKLVLMSVHGQNQFHHSAIPYLFVIGMFFMIGVQTHLLNSALAIGDCMTVFPVFQVFWIGFSVLGGVVFYESGAVSLLGTAFFILGVGLLIQHGRQNRGRISMLSPALPRPEARHMLRSTNKPTSPASAEVLSIKRERDRDREGAGGAAARMHLGSSVANCSLSIANYSVGTDGCADTPRNYSIAGDRVWSEDASTLLTGVGSASRAGAGVDPGVGTEATPGPIPINPIGAAQTPSAGLGASDAHTAAVRSV